MEPGALAKDVVGPRALGGAVVWGVLAFAIASSLAFAALDRTRYYRMADDVGDLASWRGKLLQIHGWVGAGTIVETEGGRRFVLQWAGKQIRVVDRGPPNDCLHEGREIVVGVHVAHDRDGDYVDATGLACRCASNWQGDRDRRPQTKFE